MNELGWGGGGGSQHRAGPWRAPSWFESSPLPTGDAAPREHPGDARGPAEGRPLARTQTPCAKTMGKAHRPQRLSPQGPQASEWACF